MRALLDPEGETLSLLVYRSGEIRGLALLSRLIQQIVHYLHSYLSALVEKNLDVFISDVFEGPPEDLQLLLIGGFPPLVIPDQFLGEGQVEVHGEGALRETQVEPGEEVP